MPSKVSNCPGLEWALQGMCRRSGRTMPSPPLRGLSTLPKTRRVCFVLPGGELAHQHIFLLEPPPAPFGGLHRLQCVCSSSAVPEKHDSICEVRGSTCVGCTPGSICLQPVLSDSVRVMHHLRRLRTAFESHHTSCTW